MIFGEEEKELYDNATTCLICKEEFSDDDENNYKVRDHCHSTGKFRGAAHNICNLKYREPKFTPAFFLNLSGYDPHLFMKKSRLDTKDSYRKTCVNFSF